MISEKMEIPHMEREDFIMKQAIVIMSGSFNPPTIAHHKTMLAAVNTLDADKGIYIPTPEKSLRYKMRKAGFPEEVLSEESRTAMLNAMIQDDPRLEVSDVECRHPRWHAMETMKYFRAICTEEELYYLIGSDKLGMFLRSKRLTEFLENFHFAVVVRDGEDAEPILMANEIAYARRNRFSILSSPMAKDGISSTAVREKFRNEEPGAEEMLHPKVMELMKEVDIWAKE